MQTRVEANSPRRTTGADIARISRIQQRDAQYDDEEGSPGPALHIPRRYEHTEPQPHSLTHTHTPTQEDPRSDRSPQAPLAEDWPGMGHQDPQGSPGSPHSPHSPHSPMGGYHDFHLKARLGDPQAQLNVGLCYLNGRGVKARDGKAAKWFLRAAQQGLPRAQCQFAELLACGRGVKRNDDKALAWFKRAAAADDAHALFWLAQFHEQGRGGLEACANRAYDYYRAAAELGHGEAACRQGACLWHGAGVQCDLAAAVTLYMQAAESGSVDALWKLGLCYEHGWCVEQQSAALAFTIFELAAKRGNVTGQFHLARCYWRGIGVPANRSEACTWWLHSERHLQLRVQGLRLLMDDFDLCERLGQILDYYDGDMAQEAQRVADVLATTQADAQDSDDSAEQAELAPADGQDASEVVRLPDAVDEADDEPALELERFNPRRLPRLLEVSEPSSTPSTESGNSEDDDAVEDRPLEWHGGAGGGNSTYG